MLVFDFALPLQISLRLISVLVICLDSYKKCASFAGRIQTDVITVHSILQFPLLEALTA